MILSALTGHVFNVIGRHRGGDEVWHNPGDGRFFVTGLDMKATPPVQSLGVIDAETSTLLQTVRDVRGKNAAAFAENNHIFTIVQINARRLLPLPQPTTAVRAVRVQGNRVRGHLRARREIQLQPPTSNSQARSASREPLGSWELGVVLFTSHRTVQAARDARRRRGTRSSRSRRSAP